MNEFSINELPPGIRIPYGMRSSMSGKGSNCGNAPTQSLWGRLKVGSLYGRGLATQREAMNEVLG